jgi:hypothetical protein
MKTMYASHSGIPYIGENMYLHCVVVGLGGVVDAGVVVRQRSVGVHVLNNEQYFYLGRKIKIQVEANDMQTFNIKLKKMQTHSEHMVYNVCADNETFAPTPDSMLVIIV